LTSIVLITLGLIQELKINNMTNKETAIQTLESIVHWMKTSSFDYEMIDLQRALNEVKQDYKKYLDENKRQSTTRNI
jgi:hypothetical protein